MDMKNRDIILNKFLLSLTLTQKKLEMMWDSSICLLVLSIYCVSDLSISTFQNMVYASIATRTTR